ncbi:hypothetical protein A0H81_11647 [Grifola frondosa]|uniref:Protein kinase domain-containing protein n=1 Tax=Grifola frondosa TaxID=5627 RepID=A0A1C7LWC2_GRIFR|nr:hypothetical protein A0H81_11647 [Grifola frondosa]
MEVIFNASTIYKLGTPDNVSAPPTWTAQVMWDPDRPYQASLSGADHPIHGARGSKCIYRAILQQHGSNKDGRSATPVNAALKWVTGDVRVGFLKWEVGCYENQLRKLQGIAVPRCYGFFAGFVENTRVGCLVLEWCGGDLYLDEIEMNRQCMLAAARMHEAGILHGHLDERHFVVADDRTLRVIGFKYAGDHHCHGAIPFSTADPGPEAGDPKPEDSCLELTVLESIYGKYEEGSDMLMDHLVFKWTDVHKKM